ncbi:MAG: hypothetical protein HDT46_05755 [Ruminococcaceae bacterium]|nr:hypothetical protein [Oscillospiraceae bacterium]
MMLSALKSAYVFENCNIGGVYCTFAPLWCHLKPRAGAQTALASEKKSRLHKA